jgi:MFS family permease
VSYLGEGFVLTLSLFLQATSFIAMSYAKQDTRFIIAVSVPQTIASTAFYTLSSSLMTKCVSEKEQGTVVSLSHATRSLTQVLAPLLGGYLMQHYRFSGVTILASFTSFLGGLFATTIITGKAFGMNFEEEEATDDGKKEEKSRVD